MACMRAHKLGAGSVEFVPTLLVGEIHALIDKFYTSMYARLCFLVFSTLAKDFL